MSHYEDMREGSFLDTTEPPAKIPNKYLRDLPEGKTQLDVYDVLHIFEVSNPAMQHAIKKMLAAGRRGYKDYMQDIDEAIQALERAKDFGPLF